MNAKRLVWIMILAFLASPVHAVDTAIPFIQADLVHWQGITGFGVTVAVIDDGINYAEPGLAFDIAPGRERFVSQFFPRL